MRTPAQALHEANKWTTNRVGMCLWQVQEWYNSPHAYPSAIAQWNASTHKHRGDRHPPVGVPVFYSGGNYGHIAIATKTGIRSTDAPYNGHVSNVDLDWPKRHWNHDYVGWTSDLGGLMIPDISQSPSRSGGPRIRHGDFSHGKVYLSKLHFGIKNSDSVARLQWALNYHHMHGAKVHNVPITGNYDQRTDWYVRHDQIVHGKSWHQHRSDKARHSSVGTHQAHHLLSHTRFQIVS